MHIDVEQVQLRIYLYRYTYMNSNTNLNNNSKLKYRFYWINLDRDVDRREQMMELFQQYDITNIRIPAILGTTVADREIACTKSHIKAITTFLNSTDDADVALICEDDMTLEYEPYWPVDLDTVIKNAPPDWEVIQLALTCIKLDDDFHKNITNYIPHKYNYYSTVCYAIKRCAAKRIADIQLTSSDNNQADMVLYKFFKTYTYKYPMFTHRDNIPSTINQNHNHTDFHVLSKKIVSDFVKNPNLLQKQTQTSHRNIHSRDLRTTR